MEMKAVQAAEVDSAASSTPQALRDKLKQASQDFESLFTAQMFQAMRKGMPESKLFGASSGEKIFRGMLDQEMAERISKSGGFGLGEMLYRQLAKTLPPDAPETAPGEKPAGPELEGSQIDAHR